MGLAEKKPIEKNDLEKVYKPTEKELKQRRLKKGQPRDSRD